MHLNIYVMSINKNYRLNLVCVACAGALHANWLFEGSPHRNNPSIYPSINLASPVEIAGWTPETWDEQASGRWPSVNGLWIGRPAGLAEDRIGDNPATWLGLHPSRSCTLSFSPPPMSSSSPPPLLSMSMSPHLSLSLSFHAGQPCI